MAVRRINNLCGFMIGEIMPYHRSAISLPHWENLVGCIAIYTTDITNKSSAKMLMQYHFDFSLWSLLYESDVDFIDRVNTIAIIKPCSIEHLDSLKYLIDNKEKIVWYNNLMAFVRKSGKHKNWWEVLMCNQDWYNPEAKTWIIYADYNPNIADNEVIAINTTNDRVICWTKEGDDRFYPLWPNQLIVKTTNNRQQYKVISLGEEAKKKFPYIKEGYIIEWEVEKTYYFEPKYFNYNDEFILSLSSECITINRCYCND